MLHLRLRNCAIGREGAINLGRALQFCSGLTNLQLENNCIGDEGAPLLFQGGGALATLNLTDNNITVHGITRLTCLLMPFTSLTHLDVSYNPLLDPGIFCLVRGRWMLSLRHLSLNGTGMGDVGAYALEFAFTSTTRIQQIDLDLSSLSPLGAASLRRLPRGCEVL